MCTFSYKITLRVTKETVVRTKVVAMYLPTWLEHSDSIFFHSENSAGKSIMAWKFPLLVQPWWVFKEMSSYLEIRAPCYYMFNLGQSCDAPRQRGFFEMERKKPQLSFRKNLSKSEYFSYQPDFQSAITRSDCRTPFVTNGTYLLLRTGPVFITSTNFHKNPNISHSKVLALYNIIDVILSPITKWLGIVHFGVVYTMLSASLWNNVELVATKQVTRRCYQISVKHNNLIGNFVNDEGKRSTQHFCRQTLYLMLPKTASPTI